MKSFNILLVVLLVAVSCKTEKKTDSQEQEKEIAINYDAFGAEIDAKEVMTASQTAATYNKMQSKDTINSKFTAKVLEVCQSKGCWMRVALNDNGDEAMVKFKDYGFFVPKDIAGKEVVLNGKAFVEKMSVDEQQHYAEDAGKSKEEIAQITEPKKTYRFEADGVLVKK